MKEATIKIIKSTLIKYNLSHQNTKKLKSKVLQMSMIINKNKNKASNNIIITELIIKVELISIKFKKSKNL